MFCFILTVFQKVALHSVWKFETVHSNFKHHSSSEQKNILHNMYHRLLSLKTIIFANKCKKQLLRIAGTICKSFQCSRPRRAEEIQRGGAHVFFLDILSLFALFERRLAFRALSRYFRTHLHAKAPFAISMILKVPLFFPKSENLWGRKSGLSMYI